LVQFEDEAKITRVLSKRERLTRILSQGSWRERNKHGNTVHLLPLWGGAPPAW